MVWWWGERGNDGTDPRLRHFITADNKTAAGSGRLQLYRVFFFLWIQSGGCKSTILMSFKQFLYFLHCQTLLTCLHMTDSAIIGFLCLRQQLTTVINNSSLCPENWELLD